MNWPRPHGWPVVVIMVVWDAIVFYYLFSWGFSLMHHAWSWVLTLFG